MNGDAKRVLPGWFALLGTCLWVWIGVSWVLRGAREFDLWGIVEGVGFLFFALGWLLCRSRVDAREPGRKSRAYRAGLGSILVSIVLWLGSIVVSVSGVNPMAWFMRGAPVGPAVLTGDPFVFNGQHVRTAGYVSANDRGWCVLEVDKSGPAHANDPQAYGDVIVLAARGMTCAKADTPRTWARVSGTFEALRPSRGLGIPYALTDARIVRSDPPGADSGG